MRGVDRKAIFPLLLGLFGLLYAWRMTGVAPVAPITSHLSNFYLCGAALTLVATPNGFVDRSHRPRVVIAAGVLATLNVFLEILAEVAGIDDELNRALGNVNTSDPIDCVAGLAAIALVLALLPRGTAMSALDAEVA